MDALARTTEAPLTRQRNFAAAGAIPTAQGHSRTWLLHLSLLIAGLSLFAGISMLLGIYRTALNGASICVLIYTITIIIFKDAELRGNPFHPFSLVLIVTFLNYCIRAIAIELLGIEVDAYYVGSSREHLALACMLITFYVILFYWGYRSRVGLSLAQAVPLFSFAEGSKGPRLWVLRAYVLYTVGAVTRIELIKYSYIHFQNIGEDYIQRYSAMMIDISQFSVYAFGVVAGLVILKKSRVIWLVPLALTEVILELLMGARLDLFYALIFILALYSYFLRPIRWRYVIAGLLLIVFVVVPLSYVWQHAYRSEVMKELRHGGAVARATGTDTVVRPLNYVMKNFDVSTYQLGTLQRFGELDMLLKVLDRVPRLYPFQFGDTFIPYLLEFPIPRFLWASKPLVNPTRQFAIRFGDDPYHGEYGSSEVVGPLGELYVNFGYFGLALCPLYGMVMRVLWERWKSYSRIEPCAGARMPYIMREVSMFDFVLAGYTIGLVRGSFLAYLFMVLFYGRLPTIRWLNASK